MLKPFFQACLSATSALELGRGYAYALAGHMQAISLAHNSDGAQILCRKSKSKTTGDQLYDIGLVQCDLTGQVQELCAINFGLAATLIHQQLPIECSDDVTPQMQRQQQHVVQSSWQSQGSIWQYSNSCPGWAQYLGDLQLNSITGALQSLNLTRCLHINNRCGNHIYCQPADGSNTPPASGQTR